MVETLTGKYRYRLGWRGKLVLQVEIETKAIDFSKVLSPWVDRMIKVRRFRDARIEDMTTLPGVVLDFQPHQGTGGGSNAL